MDRNLEQNAAKNSRPKRNLRRRDPYRGRYRIALGFAVFFFACTLLSGGFAVRFYREANDLRKDAQEVCGKALESETDALAEVKSAQAAQAESKAEASTSVWTGTETEEQIGISEAYARG